MQEAGPAVPYVDIIDLTADLVRAHVSRSDVPPEMLRTLIVEIHGTLLALAEPDASDAALPIPLPPGAVLASPEARAEIVSSAYERREAAPQLAVPERSPTPPKPPAPRSKEVPVEAPTRRTRRVADDEAPRSVEARGPANVSVPQPLPKLPEEDRPAVEPDRSVTPDAVIDLDGGKPHRDLGRFIVSARGEDPDAYRRRFGLPKEYPMMAPRLIRTRGRISEVDPVTLRRLSGGPVERDARFDGDQT
ncbi:MucR family transcriptional regulator [Methylobacterium brachiatum]